MKLGRTATTRTRLWIMTISVLLVAGTVWLIDDHSRGAELSSDVSVAMSVVGILVAIFGISFRPETIEYEKLIAKARWLAREVARREKAEQLKLLADAGRGRSANTPFDQVTVGVTWHIDGGSKQGSLKEVATFYTELHVGRLVVLGKPGSGKTVLIDQLLLDLIACLPAIDPESEQPLRVPVRFSLPAFDPGSFGDLSDGASEALRLSAWMTRHLVVVYGLKLAMAAALVEGGWILPILDGLDEMDAEGHEPIRAAAAVRALNYPDGPDPRPVVVACRSDRYKQLAGTSVGAGHLHVLEDATAINLEPLSIDQVAAYIHQRFPDPDNPAQVQERWQVVIDWLRSHERGALATALQSPLRLFVAITTYFTNDPRELLRVPDAQLDNHLFDGLIPAVVDQHPGPDEKVYVARDVIRWLTSIALYLRTQADHGSSESDFDLHRMWSMAGGRAPRYAAAACLGLFAALSFIPPYAWSIHTFHSWRPYNGLAWGLDALALGVVILSVYRAVSVEVSLRRLDLKAVVTKSGRRHLLIRVAYSLVVGAVLGAVFSIAYGLSFAIGFGVACGCAFGISFGLEQKPSIIAKPSVLVKQGVTHDVTIVVAFAFSFGLANGLANQLLDGLVGGLTYGLAYGCAFGIAFVAKSPWPRYFIATRMLARDKQLPLRPAEFLDWAYKSGLLRQSGISTQFRHRELQVRLAEAATVLTAPPAPQPPGTP